MSSSLPRTLKSLTDKLDSNQYILHVGPQAHQLEVEPNFYAVWVDGKFSSAWDFSGQQPVQLTLNELRKILQEPAA